MITYYHQYTPENGETVLQSSEHFAVVVSHSKGRGTVLLTEVSWCQDHRRKGNQGEWQYFRGIVLNPTGIEGLKSYLKRNPLRGE